MVMQTLGNFSVDFSLSVLADVTWFRFTNPRFSTVTASCAGSQFDTIQISPFATIEGSVGINRFTITGNVIHAETLSYLNWTTADEAIYMGTTGDDLIHGSFIAELISGLEGADILNGGGGENTLLGGAGDDRLLTDKGVIDGGAGRDLAVFDVSANLAAVTVDISRGGAGLDIGAGLTLTSVESLSATLTSLGDVVRGGVLGDLVFALGGHDLLDGRGGADSLMGEDGNDTLLGGAGNDLLDGGLKNDLARGGTGDDTLWGRSGGDTLIGEDGADILVGGVEGDLMTGGAGADRFVFTSMADSVLIPGATRPDTITDFQQGLDLIDLRRIEAPGGIHFIGQTAFFDGNEVRWRQTATETWIDIHVAAGPIQQVSTIKLVGLITLTAADFVL